MGLALTETGYCDYCGDWSDVCDRPADECRSRESTLCGRCGVECDGCNRMFVDGRDGRSTPMGLALCGECHTDGWQLETCDKCGERTTVVPPDETPVCSHCDALNKKGNSGQVTARLAAEFDAAEEEIERRDDPDSEPEIDTVWIVDVDLYHPTAETLYVWHAGDGWGETPLGWHSFGDEPPKTSHDTLDAAIDTVRERHATEPIRGVPVTKIARADTHDPAGRPMAYQFHDTTPRCAECVAQRDMMAADDLAPHVVAAYALDEGNVDCEGCGSSILDGTGETTGEAIPIERLVSRPIPDRPNELGDPIRLRFTRDD